jgi:hypothetical protein
MLEGKIVGVTVSQQCLIDAADRQWPVLGIAGIKRYGELDLRHTPDFSAGYNRDIVD